MNSCADRQARTRRRKMVVLGVRWSTNSGFHWFVWFSMVFLCFPLESHLNSNSKQNPTKTLRQTHQKPTPLKNPKPTTKTYPKPIKNHPKATKNPPKSNQNRTKAIKKYQKDRSGALLFLQVTPLLLAARDGHVAVVRQLLSCAAELNSQSDSGATPTSTLGLLFSVEFFFHGFFHCFFGFSFLWFVFVLVCLFWFVLCCLFLFGSVWFALTWVCFSLGLFGLFLF